MSNLLDIEVVTGKDAGPSFPLAEGSYDAVLIGIVQLGLKPQSYKGEEKAPKNEIKVIFEIPGELDNFGQPRMLAKKLKAVMNEKSKFYTFLKGIGIFKEPTAEEVSRVFGSTDSLNAILGHTVVLNVAHWKKDDSVIAYIETATKLDPRLPQPVAVTTPFLFTFSDPSYEVFSEVLTKYTRKEIMESLNINRLPRKFHEFYINEIEVDAGKEQKSSKKKSSTNTDVI